MPQGPMASPLMRPLVVLALPGMYLFYKYNQYKRRQQESARRRLTERELQHLHHKIDKLLTKLEENEPELASTQEEECVICITAKATMQTAPCGHRVVCRKCFVKTIQMAVSQRLLPLRCVVCRAKILRLKQESNSGSSGSGESRGSVPASASAYSVATTGTSASSMPNSDSLYSVSSGTSTSSSLSANSAKGGIVGHHGGSATATSPRCCSAGHCLGGAYPRQPTGVLRRSQQHAMKLRLQEYWHGEGGAPGRLPPIRELPPCPPPGPQAASTRIRCAQKIVTQLETAPITEKKKANATTLTKTAKTIADIVPCGSKEIPYQPLQSDKARNVDKRLNDKHEQKDNKKNELAEKKREEKAKQKAEKEAKREAKREAKKEEEQAKREAKEEKKKAKKEAKAAAAAAAAIASSGNEKKGN